MTLLKTNKKLVEEPVVGRIRQEESEFQASLRDIASSVSKTQNKLPRNQATGQMTQEIKSICCSYRRPGFSPQHPSNGQLTAACIFCRPASADTECRQYTYKTLVHPYIIIMIIKNQRGWRESSVVKSTLLLLQNMGSIPSTHMIAHNHL